MGAFFLRQLRPERLEEMVPSGHRSFNFWQAATSFGDLWTPAGDFFDQCVNHILLTVPSLLVRNNSKKESFIWLTVSWRLLSIMVTKAWWGSSDYGARNRRRQRLFMWQ